MREPAHIKRVSLSPCQHETLQALAIICVVRRRCGGRIATSSCDVQQCQDTRAE